MSLFNGRNRGEGVDVHGGVSSGGIDQIDHLGATGRAGQIRPSSPSEGGYGSSGSPLCDDITKWIELKKGRSPEEILVELEDIVHETAPWEPDTGDDSDDADDRKPNSRRSTRQGPEADEKSKVPSHTELLLKLAEDATYFHTPEGEAYASIPICTPGESSGRVEHHEVRSKEFRNWLGFQFYKERNQGLPRDAIEAVLGALEARAIYQGSEEAVHLRVAKVNGPGGECFYLDLADKQGRVVELSEFGWHVIATSPVKFRKSKTMEPHPVPERGGDVNDLRSFVNLESDDDFYLLIGLLCTFLRPMDAFPILVIQGGQGSAKTTMTELVMKLTDPCKILRTIPRSTQDLMIAARHSWLLTMNNLSGLPAAMSDALCCLSDGAGFATRELYANKEETIFKATRPMAVNGIDDIAERGDFLDRSVQLNLLRISPEKRLTKDEFWSRFEVARPKILGALLDAVSLALLEYDCVQLDRMPRMADFARWGEAVGRALGWGEGTFIAALEKNQNAGSVATLEACPVASALRKFMDEQAEWNGTATALLNALTPLAGDEITRTNNWPKIANKLTNKLRRAETPLREVGIVIEFGTTGKGRSIGIRKVSPARGGEESSASSTSSEKEDKVPVTESYLSRYEPGVRGSSASGAYPRSSSATGADPQFPNVDPPSRVSGEGKANIDGSDDLDDRLRYFPSAPPVTLENVEADDECPF